MYIFLVSLVLSILIIILLWWFRKSKEPFVAMSPAMNVALKKELGLTKCSSLYSSNLEPINMAIAKGYIDSGRIQKWKPESGDSKSNYCYILDDLENNTKDMILSGGTCDKTNPLFQAPFITDVFQSRGEQTTLTQAPNVCVFGIDNSKLNDATLDSFWGCNVGPNECQRANAFIIETYNELLAEKRLLLMTIQSIIQDIAAYVAQAGDLDIIISRLVQEILGLQKTLATDQNITSQLKQELTDLGNQLGLAKTGLAKYKSDSTLYISKQTQTKNDGITAYNDKKAQGAAMFDLYNLHYSQSNFLVTAENAMYQGLQDMTAKRNRISDTFSATKVSWSNWVRKYDKCVSDVNSTTIDLGTCSNALLDLRSSNLQIQQWNTQCSSNLAICNAAREQCNTDVNNLNNSITWYTANNAKCKLDNTACSKSNVLLQQQIDLLNAQYTWARSVYIYLSCDGFDQQITKLQGVLDDSAKKCTAADTTIASDVTTIATTYSGAESNAKTDLVACKSQAASIRADLLGAMYPPEIKIIDFAICPSGQQCPIRTAAESGHGQDWCDSWGPSGSVYTGKWVNYDGQRGGVYCAYYGDGAAMATAKSNVAAYEGSVGNVQPFTDTRLGCSMNGGNSYKMSCGGQTVDFKMCAFPMVDVGGGQLACKNNINYLIQVPKFSGGGVTAPLTELQGYCDTGHLAAGATATGKTAAFNDGTRGVYCAFTGDQAMIDRTATVNGALLANAYNIMM